MQIRPCGAAVKSKGPAAGLLAFGLVNGAIAFHFMYPTVQRVVDTVLNAL
jgi:hypothetical protein